MMGLGKGNLTPFEDGNFLGIYVRFLGCTFSKMTRSVSDMSVCVCAKTLDLTISAREKLGCRFAKKMFKKKTTTTSF